MAVSNKSKLSADNVAFVQSVDADNVSQKLGVLTADVPGVGTVVLEPKVFSTDSLGWYANGKMLVKLPDGRMMTAQVGFNLTIIGSKEARV